MQDATIVQGQLWTDKHECPRCHLPVPIQPGYIPWCDHCGWNLLPRERRRSTNPLDPLYARISKRLSKGLFEQLSKSRSLEPRLTPSKALAYLLASFVHGLTLVTAAFGILLIVRGWPGAGAIIGGLLCLMTAIGLAPRFPRFSDAGNVIAREQFPALYACVDQVAQTLMAPRVDAIVINEDFNAAYGQVGWSRKRVLYIGLPLFSILNGQERVAVFGHEIAHSVNGDPARGFFVRTAILSLWSWHHILRAFGMSPVATLTMYALLHLLWRDNQRSEYLADALAARVGGTGPALSALEKLPLGDIIDLPGLLALAAGNGLSLFEVLQRQAVSVPARELERIRQIEQVVGSRLDSTHPPIAYRASLLRAQPASPPKVVLSAEESRRLDAELATRRQAIQEKLLDRFQEQTHERSAQAGPAESA